MVYIEQSDVLGRITETALNVILQGEQITTDQEADAVNEVISYLSNDYDTDLVFQPLETQGYSLNPTIKRMMVDILIYNLHNSKVNPRNIPENVVQKRDDAIGWLKAVANPKSAVNAPFLPKKQFEEGRNNAMAWGSTPKRNNKY